MKKNYFVKAVIFLFFCNFSLLYAADLPLVGAIRWDAWSGGLATEQTARSLGPAKYHDRLPWFAVPLEENKVEIIGAKQEIMDKDIEYAVAAGLDYWAFLTYPEDSDMSIDLKQYLHSSKRKQIKFCLILHHFLGASEEDWPKELARVLSLMQEADYLKVCGNRPLLYFFASLSSKYHSRWQIFLAAAKAVNLEPYCVYMGWAPAYDYNTYKKLVFEAVSAYAKGSNKATFAELVQEVEVEYWQAAKQANVPYIPLVSSGWDKRPRKDNPVSWELNDAYHQQAVFPGKASAQEIAEHLGKAIEFVQNNRQICIANTIIIYAWNEFDEGGWISPTRNSDGSPDSSRLDAIKTILKVK